MKKSLVALAVLGAFAGAASAQSSVTIYGLLNVAVTKQNGGTASITQTTAGPAGTIRIIARGGLMAATSSANVSVAVISGAKAPAPALNA